VQESKEVEEHLPCSNFFKLNTQLEHARRKEKIFYCEASETILVLNTVVDNVGRSTLAMMWDF